MEQDLIGQAEAADAEPSKGPPADWYPDPDQAGVERYWDGRAWTDRRAPRGPSAPAQTAAPTQPALTNPASTHGPIAPISMPTIAMPQAQ